jgi:hypothetical protein
LSIWLLAAVLVVVQVQVLVVVVALVEYSQEAWLYQ